MAEQHKRLALQPSSAKRWLTCTASPIFIRDNADKIPAEEAKPYADEGTVAHEHGALGLLMGSTDALADAPPAIRPHVAGYVEAVLAAAGSAPLTVEEKVPLFYMQERNGQIDARFHTETSLQIWDYKHGAGIKVDAVENPQLLIYARSVVDYLEFQGVTFAPTALVSLNIYQPRARNANGSALTTWTIDVRHLRELTDPIEVTARLIQDVALGKEPADRLRFNPDPEPERCGWCPAKALCTAHLCGAPEEILGPIGLEVMPQDASLVGLPTVQTLTTEQMVKVWSYRKELKNLIEFSEEHLTALLKGNPEAVPGLKLVESKGGHRKWADEEGAVTLLQPKLGRAALFEEKLKSPAQLEPLIAQAVPEPSTRFSNRLKELITRGGGAPVLALASDKRPALNLSAPADPFAEVSATQTESQ